MVAAVKAGFKIVKSISRPDLDLVEQFRGPVRREYLRYSGPTEHDGRQNRAHLPTDADFVGAAITVKARPGDNLVAFKAIELAEPGDVIVIAGAFDTDYTV